VSTLALRATDLTALSELPTVFIDFTADWCRPCQVLAPIYARIADDNPELVFATVDVDTEPELAARFEVRSVPTLVALRRGVVVFRRPGLLSRGVLQALVDRVRQLTPTPPRSAVPGPPAAPRRRPDGRVEALRWRPGYR
jgi:thioredoxin-like negative regulator of GroEL